LGVGLGAGPVLRSIYPDFPMHAPGWAVGAALGVSMCVGILFGWLPAQRAAGLNPVQALMRRKA
jgi:putative ABC transport system permease protein